jgi:hypothetical protein
MDQGQAFLLGGRSEPGVQYGYTCKGEVAGIAGDDGKTAERRSRGDEQIRLRVGMFSLPCGPGTWALTHDQASL